MKALILEGKSAIVTGGAGGMGRAITEMYLKEGANVLFTDLSQDTIDQAVKEIQALGYAGKVVGIVADSSIEAHAEKAFAKTIEEFGQVDILVNNAGISKRFSLDTTTNEVWDKIIDVDLTGPMYYMRLALKHMLPRKSGSIITISSAMGLRLAGGAAYVSAKAGVIGLTRNVAFRGVDDGVRANCICPGHVETAMALKAKQDVANQVGIPMSQFTDRYVNRGARSVEAEQIANAAVYFASDLSKDVTGQALTIDAGMFMPF